MAVFKCKMCGGNLNIEENTSVCECEYCGTKQTIPRIGSEKKNNLFTRANNLRLHNEFDQAAAIYESLVSEFPDEADGYWGLCLCKFGIEYVDDPVTSLKVPTCHRTSLTSIFDDENYRTALVKCTSDAAEIYKKQAAEIDAIQKKILEIAGREEPYDVFICYKDSAEDGERTADSVLAQEIYDALTTKGLRVFFSRITLEDKLGQEYEPYIFSALNSAKVMIAVGTKSDYLNAVWVKNEWSRYLSLMKTDKSKTLIPAFRDMDVYDIPKELSSLQAQDMSKVGAIQDLVRGVEKLTGHTKNEKEHGDISALQSSIDKLNEQEVKRSKTKKVLAITIPIAIVAAIGITAAYNLFIVPQSKYDNAIHMMESGQYIQAAEAFAEMGDYKDSPDMIKRSNYLYAQQLESIGDYDNAILEFSKLNDYSDSVQKISECKYAKAQDVLNSGDTDKALEMFIELSGYSDSDSIIDSIYSDYYNKGLEAYKNKSFDEAKEYFSKSNGFSDSADYIKLCSEKSAFPYSAFYLFNLRSVSSVKDLMTLSEQYAPPSFVYYSNDYISLKQPIDYYDNGNGTYFEELIVRDKAVHLSDNGSAFDNVTGGMTLNELESILGSNFWKDDVFGGGYIADDGSINWVPTLDTGFTCYLKFTPDYDNHGNKTGTYSITVGSYF